MWSGAHTCRTFPTRQERQRLTSPSYYTGKAREGTTGLQAVICLGLPRKAVATLQRGVPGDSEAALGTQTFTPPHPHIMTGCL